MELEAARRELFELTLQARELHRGCSGIRGENRPPSLKQLGDRTRRAVEKAIQDRRHVGPEIFVRLIARADLSPEARLRHVSSYTAAFTRCRFYECLQKLSPAVADPAELTKIEITIGPHRPGKPDVAAG